MGKTLYKTGTISRMTGFSAALLRMWERRHRLVSPRRLPGGHRMYTEEDLKILRRVRELLDEGRAIGEIAKLGKKNLLSELERKAPLDAGWRAIVRLVARVDVATLLELVVNVAVEDLGAALARVWTFGREPRILHLRASAGLSRRVTTSSRARIDLDRYPYKVGEVARLRKAFIKNDLSEDPQFDQAWVKEEGIISVAALPLVHQSDLLGVVIFFFRHSLPEDVIGELRVFADAIAANLARH
jgi:DNA-binding transcriptional MerR regulator